MQAEQPPPEAVLIRRAREAVTPKLTAAAAARRARAAGWTGADGGKISISDPYWRCLEKGHGGRRGQEVPFRASDEVLALMAATVTAAGVPVAPAQLEDAGRAGAAVVLRDTAAIEPLPGAGGDEADVWAIVKQHPPGTPGKVLFGDTPEARRWDDLKEHVPLDELVAMTGWWRRRDRLDAGMEPSHPVHRAAS